MKNSKNQLTRYNKAMGAASTAAMGMMRAMLPIAGAAGLLRIGSNAVSTAAQLGRVADRLGVTTDLLQEMRYAGTELGIQQEKMDMALQRFVRRIGEAASGTGEAKAALEEMGIELRDSDGRIRTTGDLLRDIADYMKVTVDGADLLRLAFKLFDAEGADLLRMLKSGGAALDEFARRAHAAGQVLSEELIKKADELQKRWDVLMGRLGADAQRAFLGMSMGLDKMFYALSKADAAGALKNLRQELVTLNEEIDRMETAKVPRYTWWGKAIEDTDEGVEKLRARRKDLLREIEAYRRALGMIQEEATGALDRTPHVWQGPIQPEWVKAWDKQQEMIEGEVRMLRAVGGARTAIRNQLEQERLIREAMTVATKEGIEVDQKWIDRMREAVIELQGLRHIEEQRLKTFQEAGVAARKRQAELKKIVEAVKTDAYRLQELMAAATMYYQTGYLDAQTYALYLKKLQDEYGNLAKESEKSFEEQKRYVEQFKQSFVRALSDIVMTGEASWRSLARSLAASLVEAGLSSLIFGGGIAGKDFGGIAGLFKGSASSAGGGGGGGGVTSVQPMPDVIGTYFDREELFAVMKSRGGRQVILEITAGR